MLDCASATSVIMDKRKALSPERALLVGISGIDAAGKGFVTARIAELLEKRGIRPAVINIDGWLNLPDVRFHSHDRAKHFYENAIRFDEMFEQVVLPLRDTRKRRCGIEFHRRNCDGFPQTSLRVPRDRHRVARGNL